MHSFEILDFFKNLVKVYERNPASNHITFLCTLQLKIDKSLPPNMTNSIRYPRNFSVEHFFPVTQSN